MLGKREMLHGANVNSKSRRINVLRADANEQVAFNIFSVYILLVHLMAGVL